MGSVTTGTLLRPLNKALQRGSYGKTLTHWHFAPCVQTPHNLSHALGSTIGAKIITNTSLGFLIVIIRI